DCGPSAALPFARPERIARTRSRRFLRLRRLGRAWRLLARRGGWRGLHQLVEREIQEIVAALLVDEDLARVRQNLLHRFDVEPIARNLRCLAVFANDLAETRRIALGLLDDALLVAFGFLRETRGHT